MERSKIISALIAERKRQGEIGMDRVINTNNDWIAHITAYLGRAAVGNFRNIREGIGYEEAMIKAGALIIASLEAQE